ncbi:unnamed protein product [Prorocentrum cordatum]|uniref:RanBP2-type domain-containing protein n=1 Tax=Prorocentrum cordatum TaxID=2364126 RepID=A0ABN9X454_9DINO|nr:unnamed protein product [Polarella glacialis]
MAGRRWPDVLDGGGGGRRRAGAARVRGAVALRRRQDGLARGTAREAGSARAGSRFGLAVVARGARARDARPGSGALHHRHRQRREPPPRSSLRPGARRRLGRRRAAPQDEAARARGAPARRGAELLEYGARSGCRHLLQQAWKARDFGPEALAALLPTHEAPLVALGAAGQVESFSLAFRSCSPGGVTVYATVYAASVADILAHLAAQVDSAGASGAGAVVLMCPLAAEPELRRLGLVDLCAAAAPGTEPVARRCVLLEREFPENAQRAEQSSTERGTPGFRLSAWRDPGWASGSREHKYMPRAGARAKHKPLATLPSEEGLEEKGEERRGEFVAIRVGSSAEAGADYTPLFELVATSVATLAAPDASVDVYAQVHEDVKAADSKFLAQGRAVWKAWLNVGAQSGAKRASHRPFSASPREVLRQVRDAFAVQDPGAAAPARWQWQDRGGWKDHDPCESQQLEAGFHSGAATFEISARGHTYTIVGMQLLGGGLWDCAACGEPNRQFRGSCNSCGAAPPEPLARAASASCAPPGADVFSQRLLPGGSASCLEVMFSGARTRAEIREALRSCGGDESRACEVLLRQGDAPTASSSSSASPGAPRGGAVSHSELSRAAGPTLTWCGCTEDVVGREGPASSAAGGPGRPADAARKACWMYADLWAVARVNGLRWSRQMDERALIWKTEAAGAGPRAEVAACPRGAGRRGGGVRVARGGPGPVCNGARVGLVHRSGGCGGRAGAGEHRLAQRELVQGGGQRRALLSLQRVEERLEAVR